MCLQAFIAISEELRPVDVFKRLENVILAPLRLNPRAEEGPVKQIFFAYFFLGQGHDSLNFSDRNLEKNFGKKFTSGGSDPQNFF